MEDSEVLILGINGMLGHKLFMHLTKCEGLRVYGTARSREGCTKMLSSYPDQNVFFGIDAHCSDSISSLIASIKPDWVINCIGIIKQSSLGNNHVENIYINALFPHKLAQICEDNRIRLLHISTDCVFSGKVGSYTENDISDAVDLYGRCKSLGEVSYPHCLTLRTSIIGHELCSRLGLIEWFLAQHDAIYGYTRHIFSGLPTIVLAQVIDVFILPQSNLSGIYNLSSQPISKYDLLKLVAQQYGKDIDIIPYADTICDRSLDSTRLRSLLSYSLPSWPEMIEQMYQDYLTSPYGIR